MIESNKKISVSQLFCILILTRLSAEIVYPNMPSNNAIWSMVSLVISEIAMFVLALPFIVYSFRGEDFWGAIYRKNRFFGWVFALGAAAVLVGAALLTLFYSVEFALKNLLIGGSLLVLFITSAIFAVYAAIMGVESLARAGVIFLVGAVLVTVTVILADIPYMEISTSEITFDGGFGIGLDETVWRFMRGGDYLIFSALLPFVNRKNNNSAGKCGLLFGLFSTVATVLLCVVCILVLREMYGICEYPFIAAASLSDIAFFKRLDGVAAAIWVLAAVFRSGVMLLSAWKVIERVYAASTNRRKEGTA